jgi:Potential Queuosine, Q, salvage protein family
MFWTEEYLIITGIEKVVDSFKGNIPRVEWNFEKIHYLDNGPLTVQYIFVIDTLNFCFWPGMNNWSYLFRQNTNLEIKLHSTQLSNTNV